MLTLLSVFGSINALLFFVCVRHRWRKLLYYLIELRNANLLTKEEADSYIDDYEYKYFDPFTPAKPLFLPKLEDVKSENPVFISYQKFRMRSLRVLRISFLLLLLAIISLALLQGKTDNLF